MNFFIRLNYILIFYKIFKKSKINSYVINQMFKFLSFYSIKLCTKDKFINKIVNNI